MSGSEAMVGSVLNGRWRLVRLIGEGGMGSVYAAEGTRGEGTRAIKVLHPEFVQEPEVLRRFIAEAYAAQHLQHPNVAKVFEHAQTDDGSPYLVMELLEGIPLSQYVRPQNPIPATQAAPIVYGVLQALASAHAQGIVHRDLKPDNIHLVPDGSGRYVVKVLDFGIAKVMDVAGGMGSKTRTGMMLGTPGYMSPEQVKDAKHVDHRTDLWSVGIMFYEMLTGTSAFDAPTEFAKLTAVITQDPKPIAEVAPRLAGWSAFFARAIARAPEARFASADDMAQTLLATARALAGPAVLPTAEFQSLQVQRSSLDATAPMGREGTHVSPQLPTYRGSSRPSAPASVEVLQPRRSTSPPPGGIRVPVVVVVLIAVLCLVLGFLAGAGSVAVGIHLSG